MHDRRQFADQIGIGMNGLEALFAEPLLVSNPGAILLRKMARVLNVSVGHLLGESAAEDVVYVASLASWKQWVNDTDGLDAKIAFGIREKWIEEYELKRDMMNESSQKAEEPMSKADWAARYAQYKAKTSRTTSSETIVAVPNDVTSIFRAGSAAKRRS
jgi:hypothetical protein